MNCEDLQPQQGLIDRIREHLGLPTMWVCLQKSGGAQNENYRKDLRRGLIRFLTEKLKNREITNVDNLSDAISELVPLTDLSTLPHLSYASVSISHCPVLGGYAITPTPDSVGFDIELNHRVNSSHIKRVSQVQKELLEAPHDARLWVAKEAAFKALQGPQQPATVSEIQTFQWEDLEDNLWSFRFECTNKAEAWSLSGRGCVARMSNEHDNVSLGFAVI